MDVIVILHIKHIILLFLYSEYFFLLKNQECEESADSDSPDSVAASVVLVYKDFGTTLLSVNTFPHISLNNGPNLQPNLQMNLHLNLQKLHTPSKTQLA